jgi:DNA-binding CsgD family transcriptional regulator
VAEALELAEQTEQETYVLVARHAEGQVAAYGGDLGAARVAGEAMLRTLEDHPDRDLEGMARVVLARAALDNGDPSEADRQLSLVEGIREAQHVREPAAVRYHPDHVEAVIALGDLERAERLVRSLEQRAAAVPRPWILAVSARSRGLLRAAQGDLDGALADFERALDAQQNLEMPSELGRTLVALGRLHRRRNERLAAQHRLEEAVRTFEGAGAARWAATARDELRKARARRGTADQLTPTEHHIAELAASGLRNQEIAARLFLSDKTVEASLTRAYRKLGIRSRAELGRRLPTSSPRPDDDKT